MTAPEWSVDELGALADEWLAERDMFLSSVQAYLATQLPKVSAAQQQSLPEAAYHAELANIRHTSAASCRSWTAPVVYPATPPG